MTPADQTAVDRGLRLALRAWLTITAAIAMANGGLYLLEGPGVFRGLVQAGPYSQLALTLVSVAVVWLAAGTALLFLQNRALLARRGLLTFYVFLIVVLHTNVLRERAIHGDFEDYIRAAHNLVEGAPLHDRYLYPPFAATVLSFLLPLGDNVAGFICWTINILALALLSVLLPRALERYGFGKHVSLLLSFGFLVVNVPLFRTLEYIQVNLNVVCLLLVSLLAYPRFRFVSAIALATAVHFKASPIVLVLPFLLHRDWRWMAWFILSLAAIAGMTVVPYGWHPFVRFYRNVSHIYEANPIIFRETSVDSFFRSLGLGLGFPAKSAMWMIVTVKAGILAATGFTLSRVVRMNPFVGKDDPAHTVYNTFPVALVLMLLLSPLLWEHHPVLAALSYLVVLKRLKTPVEWVLYGFAYFLEYLLPTFDFFPWSFGRLLSPLILLWIFYVTSGREEEGPFRDGVAAIRAALCGPAPPAVNEPEASRAPR